MSGGKGKAKQTPCASNIRESFTGPQPQRPRTTKITSIGYPAPACIVSRDDQCGRKKTLSPACRPWSQRVQQQLRTALTNTSGSCLRGWKCGAPKISLSGKSRWRSCAEQGKSGGRKGRDDGLLLVLWLRYGKVLEVLLFPFLFLPCWKRESRIWELSRRGLTTTADIKPTKHGPHRATGRPVIVFRVERRNSGGAEGRGRADRGGPGHVQSRGMRAGGRKWDVESHTSIIGIIFAGEAHHTWHGIAFLGISSAREFSGVILAYCLRVAHFLIRGRIIS